MIPKTLTSTRQLSPWVNVPAPQTRHFVSREALRLIRSTPVGEAALSAFQFQQGALCEANSRRMQWVLTSILVGKGVAWRPEFDTGSDATSLAPIGSTEDLLKVNAKFGPLVLTLFKALQPDQGADIYTRHHCVVLLCSFEHKGKKLGLLLDGNDLQCNPVMVRLQQWLKDEGKGRRLADLSSKELTQIGRSWASASNNEPDLHQTAFRLVDLEHMVQRSQADKTTQPTPRWWEWLIGTPTQTDMRWATYYMGLQPPMSAEAIEELKSLIDENPSLVEPVMPPEPEL